MSSFERFKSYDWENNEKWKIYLSNVEFPSNVDVTKKTEELKKVFKIFKKEIL
jgi:hypothetical protein